MIEAAAAAVVLLVITVLLGRAYDAFHRYR